MNLKPRRGSTRTIQKKILIVCEGEQTEPNYFLGFRVASQVEIVGTGRNTLSLVKKAVELNQGGDFREVWCVFDKDSFKQSAVDAAFKLADKNGFKVAFSNQCFELWYVLHFDYLDADIHRSLYVTRLKDRLGNHEKNSASMYDRLLAFQKQAIKHARTLAKSHGPHLAPAECVPYTTVHELVERLNKLAMSAH